jgi:uncharacterized membrane protein
MDGFFRRVDRQLLIVRSDPIALRCSSAICGGHASARSEHASMSHLPRLTASALFLASGTLHFAKPEMFCEIVPPALPAPGALVAISGAAEIAGAVGLWVPKVRRSAALGLIALLFAVFPANVYMALDHDRFARLAPAWALYARLPLQVVLAAWMWALRT